jgi:serine/threonine-protein kinase
MFECVSGHSPFASRKGMEVLFAHLRDDPGDPCAERADAPPEFVEQLLLALAKDPDARPASAGAYARGLRQAAGL